jgi:hypothetical protein
MRGDALSWLSLFPPGICGSYWVDYQRCEVVLFFEVCVIAVFNDYRIDILMDRRLKRPSDGEPSGSSQRQRVEGNTAGSSSRLEHLRRSHGFSLETTPTTSRSQELREWHERTSSEVPASQQVGGEYLLGLRNQLQETHHRSQAILEGLDQHIAQMQQQAGHSEVPVSTSHQQDTRALQTSLHPPTRNEQSMLQHQQEEVFDIHDYLVASPSDSDHESDQRDFLEAHEPKRVAPIQSSTSHSSDALFQKYPLDNLRQQGKIEQRQDALVQQHEVYDQVGPSHPRPRDQVEQDLLRQSETHDPVGLSNMIELMKQIEDKPLTWKRRRERLEHLVQSSQPPEPEQTGQIDMIEVMKHIENLTELTWKQRREMLEGWIGYSQSHEQGQAILPQRHEGQDQAGPSHYRDAQCESLSEQKRTWTTEELHQLVDDMVRIKDFDHKTFQDALSEESKAICEQLNKYSKSFNDQEWSEIKARLIYHNILAYDKRYKYLYNRESVRREKMKNR